MSFQVIAHRGASGYAPENTAAAFRAALTLGADAIETDLRLSKDGRIVLMHDATVDRTTDGSGRVEELTAAELKSLDAGAWFDPAYRGDRVLFLEEALALVDRRVPLVLEIKESARVPHLLSELKPALRRTSSSVVISSFAQQTLLLAREHLPSLPLAWLIPRGRFTAAEAIAQARPLGVQQLCPHALEVDAQWVRTAQEAGYAVRAWGIPGHSPAEMVRAMRHLVRCGASGATADFPDVLRSVVTLSANLPAG